MFTVKLQEGVERKFVFHHNTECNIPTAYGNRQGTRCVVFDDRDEIVGGSMTLVHPNDNYSRSEGRKFALKYAIQNYPRPLRTKIWEAYWNKLGGRP